MGWGDEPCRTLGKAGRSVGCEEEQGEDWVKPGELRPTTGLRRGGAKEWRIGRGCLC